MRSRGRCEAAGFDGIACNGNLQTMHIVSRRYLSVRWDDDNALAGCAAHHTYFTHDPLAWEEFVLSVLGHDDYYDLKRRARSAQGAPDYDVILRGLQGGDAEQTTP